MFGYKGSKCVDSHNLNVEERHLCEQVVLRCLDHDTSKLVPSTDKRLLLAG